MLAGHGTPMRRLIESGAVQGRNFVQVGLRGYWPPVETFQWMAEHGLRYHFMREIEERGAEAVIARPTLMARGRGAVRRAGGKPVRWAGRESVPGRFPSGTDHVPHGHPG